MVCCAGCALANSTVISAGEDHDAAIKQAFIIADKMILALESSREIQLDSANKKTEPALRRAATKAFPNTIPDPNLPKSVGFYSITSKNG